MQNSSAVLTARCCWTLNTVELLFTVAARSRDVSTSTEIFSSLDGCLKYKNNEKPKAGPRPSPHLNYDVNIGPKPSPRDVKTIGARLYIKYKNIFNCGLKVCCNASVTEHVLSKILLKMNALHYCVTAKT